jgi:SOS-response transcriptional repressor LexA
MLTSDKTDFKVTYIDPESNTLRSYYPDFLAQKKDGSYVIVEVKGENKIEDAVVQAKAHSATEIASANAMEYLMVPGMKAAYGLRQPKFQPLVGPRVYSDEEVAENLRFVSFLPIFSLEAACGYFSSSEMVEQEGWVKAEGIGKLDDTMVVVRAIGDSMEPKIHDGDLCVVRKLGAVDYSNRIVLAQRNDCAADPETGGSYLLKQYVKEGGRTFLRSLNSNYHDIPARIDGNIAVVAYLHKVL